MRRVVILWLSFVLAACGGDAPPRAATTTTRALPSLAAPAASTDDVIVAKVNDRPVWGSCVAAQAKAGAADVKAALGECIDLELAAQEAERRGLASDPDVVDTLEQALASAFVAREFDSKVSSAADLPPALVESVFKKNAWRMHREEYRGSFFARIELTDPEGSPADIAARDAIQAAYKTLAGRSDLFPTDVETALRAAARPGQKVGTGAPDPATFGATSRLQPYYHEPLFALTSIGQVAPPVRGPYGWDLILFTTRLDPLERTREDVLADLFPAMRMRWFIQWSSEFGKGRAKPLVTDDATLRQLLGGDE